MPETGEVPVLTVSSDSNLQPKEATKAAPKMHLSPPRNSLDNFTRQLLAVGMGHTGDDSEAIQLLKHVKRKKRECLINEPAPFFSFTAHNLVSGSLPTRKLEGRRSPAISMSRHHVNDVIIEMRDEDDVTGVRKEDLVTESDGYYVRDSGSQTQVGTGSDTNRDQTTKPQEQDKQDNDLITGGASGQESKHTSVGGIPPGHQDSPKKGVQQQLKDKVDNIDFEKTVVNSSTFAFFEQDTSGRSPRFLSHSPDKQGDIQVLNAASTVSSQSDFAKVTETQAGQGQVSGSVHGSDSPTTSPGPGDLRRSERLPRIRPNLSATSNVDFDDDSGAITVNSCAGYSPPDATSPGPEPTLHVGPQGDVPAAFGEVEVITGLPTKRNLQMRESERLDPGPSLEVADDKFGLSPGPGVIAVGRQQREDDIHGDGDPDQTVPDKQDLSSTSEGASPEAAASSSASSEERRRLATLGIERQVTEVPVGASSQTSLNETVPSLDGDGLLHQVHGPIHNVEDKCREPRPLSRRERPIDLPPDRPNNAIQDATFVRLKENTLQLTTLPDSRVKKQSTAGPPVIVSTGNESLGLCGAEDDRYSYSDDSNMEEELRVPCNSQDDVGDSESTDNELFTSCIEEVHSVEVPRSHKDEESLKRSSDSLNKHLSLKPEVTSFRYSLQRQNRFTIGEKRGTFTKEEDQLSQLQPPPSKPGTVIPLRNVSESEQAVRCNLKPVRTEIWPGPSSGEVINSGVAKKITGQPIVQPCAPRLHRTSIAKEPSGSGNLLSPTLTCTRNRQYCRVAKKLPILVSDHNVTKLKGVGGESPSEGAFSVEGQGNLGRWTSLCDCPWPRYHLASSGGGSKARQPQQPHPLMCTSPLLDRTAKVVSIPQGELHQKDLKKFP